MGKLQFLDKLKSNPKRVFLIDAFGALLSAISLLGVLAQLERYFGMPIKILYILSGIAFCLFVYSMSCSLLIKLKWKFWLMIIIICNTAYIVVSLGLIIKYSEKLTTLGFIYFILELIAVGMIVILEFKAYSDQP